MKILFIGFDVDIVQVEERLGSLTCETYFQQVPCPEGPDSFSFLEDLPDEFDIIAYVVSEYAHGSSQILSVFSIVADLKRADEYWLVAIGNIERKFIDFVAIRDVPEISLNAFEELVRERLSAKHR